MIMFNTQKGLRRVTILILPKRKLRLKGLQGNLHHIAWLISEVKQDINGGILVPEPRLLTVALNCISNNHSVLNPSGWDLGDHIILSLCITACKCKAERS